MSKRSFSFSNNPLMAGPALDERAKGGIPYREIPLSAIEADPHQPRQTFDEEKLQELADSIKLYGVLSPILVRAGQLPGRYTVISGERRFRAAHLAGLSSIPAMVNHGEDVQGRTLAIQLVENLQRDDLTPIERAHAIGALRDGNSLSIRDIAEKLSISKSAVQRSLDILQLPDDLLNALRQGASESKVLLLAKIEDEQLRATYLKDLDLLTRAQLEKNLGKGRTDNDDVTGEPKVINAEDLRIADEIQRALGMKVKLIRSNSSADSGKLMVEFYAEGDLQILFRKLIAE
ncbi:MAG: ParB/RepB/Spo0J family partition protein [Proteobacteria bacterium]|nr:ParB/RepB/Spo0J family partition protein [Pseudomonadota bacterium]